jgi:hypothetical protein
VSGEKDTYYRLHRHNQPPSEAKKNGSPPIINLCSDTFWLFSSNRHGIYETSKSWNQVFKDNYPQLYALPLQQANIPDPTRTD